MTTTPPSTPLTRLPPRHDRQCHLATTLLPAPPASTPLHRRRLDTASITTLDTGMANATHLVQPTPPHPHRRRFDRVPHRHLVAGTIATHRPRPRLDHTLPWPPRRGRLVTTATTASAALLRRHLGTDPVATFSPTTLALPLYGTPPPVPLYYTTGPSSSTPTAPRTSIPLACLPQCQHQEQDPIPTSPAHFPGIQAPCPEPATTLPQRTQPEKVDRQGKGDTNIDSSSSNEDDFDSGLNTCVWNRTGALLCFLWRIRFAGGPSSGNGHIRIAA
ncbi:hypothetical protein EDB85DRAFT_2143366 [Lactarius pseudohatsudake]|nr:hypothetical protein EDB85DRAFT_2143366 [Lactarius pseudohatsudake]